MRRETLAQGEFIQPRAKRAALLERCPRSAGDEGPRVDLMRAVFDEWLQHLSGSRAGRVRTRARLLEAGLPGDACARRAGVDPLA